LKLIFFANEEETNNGQGWILVAHTIIFIGKSGVMAIT